MFVGEVGNVALEGRDQGIRFLARRAQCTPISPPKVVAEVLDRFGCVFPGVVFLSNSTRVHLYTI